MPKKYNYTKKTGRPLKTKESVLPANWKELVFNFAASGLSKEEIYLQFYRKHNSWFDDLYERDLEFSAVIKKAENLCKGWWIEQSRKSLKRQYYQSALWYMNMKNRFGWKDKTDIEHSMSDSTIEKFASLPVQELIAKANAIIGKPTIK